MIGYGILFLGLFLPALAVGWNLWKIILYYKRTHRFIKVPGKVIGIDIQKASDFGTYNDPYKYYAPLVEFTTKENITYKALYAQDNPDRPLYAVGEALTICYDPQNPKRFIIHDPQAEYLVASVWIVIGLVVGFFTYKAILF